MSVSPTPEIERVRQRQSVIGPRSFIAPAQTLTTFVRCNSTDGGRPHDDLPFHKTRFGKTYLCTVTVASTSLPAFTSTRRGRLLNGSLISFVVDVPAIGTVPSFTNRPS